MREMSKFVWPVVGIALLCVGLTSPAIAQSKPKKKVDAGLQDNLDQRTLC